MQIASVTHMAKASSQGGIPDLCLSHILDGFQDASEDFDLDNFDISNKTDQPDKLKKSVSQKSKKIQKRRRSSKRIREKKKTIEN